MNILVISTKSPFPLKDGHSLRTFNLLKHASNTHNLYLLTYFLSQDEASDFHSVMEFTKKAEGFMLRAHNSKLLIFYRLFLNLFSLQPLVAEKFKTRRMDKAIIKILNEEKIDIVHIDLLPLMSFYEIIKQYPIVLVDHNVESELVYKRIKYTRNIAAKLFLLLQYYKLYAFEKKQIARARCCIAVSHKDSQTLARMQPCARIRVIENGVDTEYFKPRQAQEENSLIYVGGLDWFPNLDAVDYFTRSIYPKIMERTDNLKVGIIGKVPQKYNKHKLFDYLGYVEDIRPYMEKAKVFIVPLRIGGGTRLKILNAMSMGKAIVTTSIGCEGLEAQNGIHLIIEDTEEGFAKAIAELLQSEDKRKSLGTNARKLAEEKYDWKIIGEKMNRIYADIGN